MRLKLFLFLSILSFFQQTWAINETAETLSTKSFLEDLLVKRYTQSLNTIIDSKTFALGAQLEIEEIDPDEVPAVEEDAQPFDLLVGHLDSEQLIKQYGIDNVEKSVLVSFLSNKKIRSVLFSVGLKEDLGQETKKIVEKWMTDRATKEFGPRVKIEATFVKELVQKTNPEVKKDWTDWLNQFQHLIGLALLALSALIGIIIWRMMTGKASISSNNVSDGLQMKVSNDGNINMNGSNGRSLDGVDSAKLLIERARSLEEITSLSLKINNLLPKLSDEMQNLVHAWCNAGEEGQFKLVCFADVVGAEIGRLSIPPESISDVAKIFATMSTVDLDRKKTALEKVYWDLVAVLNLGSSIIEQPFSYLSNSDSEAVSEILMSQNPKLKTLVSLYLPEDIRRKFINIQSTEQKLEMLQMATQLNEIPRDELTTLNASVKNKMLKDSSVESVKLDLTFEKIVSTLSVFEEIDLLPKLGEAELKNFKQKTASIAFLHEWPDNQLSLLMQKLRPEQIVNYIRVKPDCKDRLLQLCPPMTSEVVSDDLSRSDRMTQSEKEKSLSEISNIIKDMVRNKEVILADIFTKTTSDSSEKSNVVSFKTA